MADNVLWGQYIASDSVVHRLDPRTKLLSVLAFTFCCLFLTTWGGYAVATVLAGGQLLLSRVPFRTFGRAIKPVLLIVSFTLLYHLLVTREGIESGVFVVWRILLLVSLASLLTLTTKPLELAKGLEQLLKPLSAWGVPVEAMALTVMLAIRFIPTISEELDRMILAQQARGFDIKSARGHRQGLAYLSLVVPLLITTIQRAEQLAMTIDARAYGNGKGRTSYRVLTFSRTDYAAGGLLLACILLILYL
ncbi:energy-coupling factor transporter transmembrane protein EcfT [Paenibacillus tritici]|uniref:energy-coupling factor transporter transmembrane component T family protein n=1 Tax=Paenibacillus tritici TaxID=1873425 RepID=UPI001BAB3B1C|nr:energy-coupling factor transporter transmembrane component T [Paenibacillus tritici]QUL52122.1 energy-coupling factor transporter transmembrane protein EcfT [Paenibacillus tritici]